MDEDNECNDLVNSEDDDFDPRRGASDQSQDSNVNDDDESYGRKKKTQKPKSKGKKTRNEPLIDAGMSDNDSVAKQPKP